MNQTSEEHRLRAEELLAYAQAADENARPGYRYMDIVAEAGVHALLSIAAFNLEEREHQRNVRTYTGPR